MQRTNIISTFETYLRNCRNVIQGLCCHQLLIKHGLEDNPFLINLLLQMYTKNGSLYDAEALFCSADCPRDIFAWNFIITGRAHHGHEPMALFNRMFGEGVFPDNVSFGAIISNVKCLNTGKLIHALVMDSCFNVSVSTSLIHMYGRCGSLCDASEVFNGIHVRDVVAWNCILGIHCDHHMEDKTLLLYEMMQLEGVVPDKVTFIIILSACTVLLNFSTALFVHFSVVIHGFDDDVTVGNALVNMYARCCGLETVMDVFNKLSQKNIVTWNTILGAHAQKGRGDDIVDLLIKVRNEGICPDNVTFVNILSACSLQDVFTYFDMANLSDVMLWNALISSLCRHGQNAIAVQMYHQMQEESVIPNNVSFIAALTACAAKGSISSGKRRHVEAVSSCPDIDTSLGNALIKIYLNFNDLKHAESIFYGLLEPNIVSFTIMISGYVKNGNCREALQWFIQMQQRGFAPDTFIFASILDACASFTSFIQGSYVHVHVQLFTGSNDLDVVACTSLLNMYNKCGNYKDAKNIFEMLFERNTISFNAMIDTCANHGQGDDALLYYNQMQKEGIGPDPSTFVSILSACSHCGLLEEGVLCFYSMLSSREIRVSAEHYDCLVDLYSRSGQLNEARYIIMNEHVSASGISYRTLLRECFHQTDVECAEYAANQAFMLEPGDNGSHLLLLKTIAVKVIGENM